MVSRWNIDKPKKVISCEFKKFGEQVMMRDYLSACNETTVDVARVRN